MRHGGILQALYESAIGNGIGVHIDQLEDGFAPEYGGYLITSDGGLGISEHLHHLGYTIDDGNLTINGQTAAIKDLYTIASGVLADVYPPNPADNDSTRPPLATAKDAPRQPRNHSSLATPRVCLPVFPGTNSELDTARAFRKNGGDVIETVICNQNRDALDASLQAFADHLANSQILVLAGGFSAGDEPDGSGKYMANVLANPRIADAIAALLERDGLILGICNGFQALIKSGLLPRASPPPSLPTTTARGLPTSKSARRIASISRTAKAASPPPMPC